MARKREFRDIGISRAAQILGVAEGTVRVKADQGKLPQYRDDAGRRRFRAADLEAHAAQSRDR